MNKYDKLPTDFVWQNYIELNSDLKNMSEFEAKNHYLSYGINESRQYKYDKLPTDFVWQNYIELNSDLKNMSEFEAKNHYLSYGINESRQYKYDKLPTDFVKYICIYFPQFHEIEENNHWEKGWTDFTWLKEIQSDKNQNSLCPIIKPHRDIGYYNILEFDIRKKQGEIAKSFGIHGFCYYHYWFYGYKQKCIMHNFFDKLLEDNEPNIPFFINWANEPWTKKWNNGENDIICNQNYDKMTEEIYAHFNYLLPLFKHKNYIKTNNKPIFVIYQIYHLGSFDKLFIDSFNILAKLNGFEGIFFIQSIGLNHSGNNKINDLVDGAYETIPNNSFMSLWEKGKYSNEIDSNNSFLLEKNVSINYMDNYDKNEFIKYNPDVLNDRNDRNDEEIYGAYLWYKKTGDISRLSKFNVFDDKIIYYEALNYKKYIKNQYYGITPGFNNFPRTQNKCKTTMIISKNNNRVELFKNTLNETVLKTIANDAAEKFIFINAWNEWGEGMCIEPDNTYGYSFLNSLKRVLIENKLITYNTKKKCAVLTTYKNRPDELMCYYKNIKRSFELKTDIHFDFFLLNQDNDLEFNKTKLWNAGINEVIDKYDFYIFNDLDHFANDENNFDYLYSYPDYPTHMSAYVEQFNFKPNGCTCNIPKDCTCDIFKTSHMCGGVFKINNTDLKKIKGFNNDFVGWGNEDCDISYRIRAFTKLHHLHGVYNSDVGDNYHRYFNCDRYISNKLIMYFTCENPNYYIENNGYHTLKYKVNSITSKHGVAMLNIDFSYENKYYLIINTYKTDNNLVEYISNKFNSYYKKPSLILVNPCKKTLLNLNQSCGIVMINDNIKIIGDISFIVNNANNSFICNYRALFNSCNNYDYDTNDYNHIFFNNVNSFSKITCKEKEKKNIYDVFKMLNNSNCILSFKNQLATCGLITSNLGYYMSTNETNRKTFDFDFRYLSEGVDLISKSNYNRTLFLPPIIVNEYISNEFDIHGFIKNNYSDLKTLETTDMSFCLERFNFIDFCDDFINMTYRLNNIW